ncbi:TonB-dependent receptor family protein [Methylobacterium haplocladii]|nr:TonB-dependent receptor [Methylobacterium haplocladii]GJD83057.1 Vitamin B12 transporter BtuB [Methylobacterium haplocladii]
MVHVGGVSRDARRRSSGAGIGAGLIAASLLVGSIAEAQTPDGGVTLPELAVAGDARPSQPWGLVSAGIARDAGTTVSSVGRNGPIDDRPAADIGTVLLDSPGVTTRPGNGGRDVIISIRGSNARSTRVTRNLVVLEDGFPLTQPDGVSRFDLADPHAYAGIDVFRGPQSARFGNYATGGALAFHTRSGGSIDGYEIGSDTGSFGSLSRYFTVGGASGPVEISLFASDARGNGFQDHASYDTQTVNLLATYTPTPDDRFVLKVIDNDVDADLPARSSLNQFRINPYQRGCAAAASAAPGCTLTNLPRNGAFGPTVGVTADEGGFRRNDRRSILGARWEHDFDAETTGRAQVVLDERNFDQPFYVNSVRGSYPSINLLADLTRRTDFFGLPAVASVALNYSTIDIHATTFNRAPYGGPRLGALIGDIDAEQSNLGGRARTEVALSDSWTGVFGFGLEKSGIAGRSLAYAYSAAGRTTTRTEADRSFLNLAPELALVYRPNAEWAFRGRAATGYATPTASNLFVTVAGLPGNNTGLRTQQDLGFDLGADWTPWAGLRVSLTTFYEFFRNELVAQSPGPGLLAYTFNVPASEHRGIELGADWAFAPGWRAVAAYTYDDQIYTRFTEQLSAGAFVARFDRAGNAIPGVPANQLLLRIGYDEAAGPWQGLGGYVETVVQDGVFVDAANRLTVPGYAIVNANLHYGRPLTGGYAKRIAFYVELRNVFDMVYAASVQNLTNTISARTGSENGAGILAATPGSIVAGAPRNVVCGMKLSF